MMQGPDVCFPILDRSSHAPSAWFPPWRARRDSRPSPFASSALPMVPPTSPSLVRAARWGSGGNTPKDPPTVHDGPARSWDLWSVAIRTSILWSGRKNPRRHDVVLGKRLEGLDVMADRHARACVRARRPAGSRRYFAGHSRPESGRRMAGRRTGYGRLPEFSRPVGSQKGAPSCRQGGAPGREGQDSGKVLRVLV